MCVSRTTFGNPNARVSTYGQTLDAQLEELKAEGCAKIYGEKASGAQADRRELLRMLKEVVAGDVVTVTRIDRLARSTFDQVAIVKQIVDDGGQFRSLAEPWADTATGTGRMLIAVLGGMASVERDLSAPARQRAGAAPRRAGSTWVESQNSPRISTHASSIEPEKRLFYVGVTRAEQVLMYVCKIDRFGNPPNRFLGPRGVGIA